ncbi:MAG: hypothetical protein GX130_12165 [Candidatus Hydrogenedens sp.]|jgi:hypothetical protein|nr:hypothetical protein [Candidatus Hydrogenedens sp.]
MKRVCSIAGLMQAGRIAGGYGLLSLLVVVYSLGFCAHHHASSCLAAAHDAGECCEDNPTRAPLAGEKSVTAAICHCMSFHLHPAPGFDVPEQRISLSAGHISMIAEALVSEPCFRASLFAADKFPSEEFRWPSPPERNLPLLS